MSPLKTGLETRVLDQADGRLRKTIFGALQSVLSLLEISGLGTRLQPNYYLQAPLECDRLRKAAHLLEDTLADP